MTSPARFLGLPTLAVPLIVVVGCFFEMSCGSSGTKAPDAEGGDAAPDAASVDMAPDVTTTDVGGTSDGTPADVASDKGASDVGQTDGGGADRADGGDGASDRCNPPCLAKLYGGCLPGGTCVTQGLASCYTNGVKVVNSPATSGIVQTTYKNGVECATLEVASSDGTAYTFRDPNGAELGTITIASNGDQTLSCTGEPSVVLPGDCPRIICSAGTCN